jgi:predicted ATPase
MLLADGWTLLHASAAVRDGQTVLTFGSKGAGKTTTALALATRGWRHLLRHTRDTTRQTVVNMHELLDL